VGGTNSDCLCLSHQADSQPRDPLGGWAALISVRKKDQDQNSKSTVSEEEEVTLGVISETECRM
jgi:hypothetical protein